ncbi:hypothetical protein PanWU01x14_321290 [Parasponia andersonii]|uniref:Uncharacterized protein n=1 Tax=Parasponia andersonii TaxID=3476 RepID=A0A2P5AL84_PARAD|nr:hypothetical protein PanWU01x14_321290 [Parasponia andersonii]
METKNAKLSKEIVKISITQQKQHIDEITHASIVAKSYDSSSSQPESQPTRAELSPPPATQSPQRAAKVTIPNIVDNEFILEDITKAAPTHVVGQPISNQARYDLTRKLRVEAPEFDGHLDPSAFLDSLAAIEDYFDNQHIRFAKMKLTCSARQYWQTILNNIALLGQVPITFWDEMKEKLKEKYLHLITIVLSYVTNP